MNLYNLGAWILLSGSLFTLFSYFANQYHEQKRTSMQFLQDFIGGILFMSFLAVLIPDYFPDIFKLVSIPTGVSALAFFKPSSASASSENISVTETVNNKSFVSLLPKIGGFLNSSESTSNSDDIQLQLGPIPSGSLGRSV